MLYHYIAGDKSGKIVEDDIEADTLPLVLQFLAGRDLRPISIKAFKAERTIGSLFGKITLSDQIFLTKYLGLMLKVGTDLLSATNILISDFDKPAMRNFLLDVRDNLSHGRPFYEAFARYPKAFSLTTINLIKAAEASGKLEETFEKLSISLAKEAELRSQVRSAFIYPAILLVMMTGIIGFLVTYVIPKIANTFGDAGIKPPPFSSVVFGIGLFIGGHIATIGISLAVIISFSVYFFWKNRVGRVMLSNMLAHLPLVRNIYRELAIQRFASTMSSLMDAGLPIIETLNITADTVGNADFRLALQRVGGEGLAKGLTIGEAFKREPVFPKVVTNLIAISEKAGHLGEVLGTLADFYANNVDGAIKSLVAVMEPALLLIMGLLVATIALSIIIPIYQLTTQF